MQSTPLSTILNEIDSYQELSRIEEQFKVRFLDEGLRGLRRKTQFPWTLKKGTLKVFQDVLEYPVPDDYDEMAYQDSQKGAGFYGQRARYKYTSVQQFFEDPTNRNTIAEIFDEGTRFLGVNYKDFSASSVLLSQSETQSLFTVSGDATTATLDNVIFKVSNGSMRISITNSSGVATIVDTFTSISDSNYKQKYYFRWIYLDAVPTSIELRLQTDNSNYLSSGALTTQFSGQALKADDWNLLAFDLNEATETGTFDSDNIASQAVIFTGASTGEYRLDASYMRQWDLQDLWYYSAFNVKTVGASIADQQYFFKSGIYSTDSSLVSDSEWTDVIKYDAMTMMSADLKESNLFAFFTAKRQEAWNLLLEKYPSLKPLIITTTWRLRSQMGGSNELLNDVYHF